MTCYAAGQDLTEVNGNSHRRTSSSFLHKTQINGLKAGFVRGGRVLWILCLPFIITIWGRKGSWLVDQQSLPPSPNRDLDQLLKGEEPQVIQNNHCLFLPLGNQTALGGSMCYERGKWESQDVGLSQSVTIVEHFGMTGVWKREKKIKFIPFL